jgi:hypothetical protein
MSLKKLWTEYLKSDEDDPVLDEAIASIQAHAARMDPPFKLSEEDIIDIAGQLFKEKISLASAKISLEKVGFASGLIPDLLSLSPSAVADLVASVQATGTQKQKMSLVKQMIEIAEGEADGDLKATQIAKHLKDRHQWAPFERFFEKLVVPARAGLNAPRSIGNMLNKDDFFFHLQEYQRGKGFGLPWYVQFSVLFKFFFVIIRRLLKIGTVLGLISAAIYGGTKIYDFFSSKDDEPAAATPSKKDKSGADKPAESMPDSIERQLNRLYGAK